MITQNPIIGHARNKLGGVYARTMYGKNIIQTCPPPTKGKETPNQIAARQMFGFVSRLSMQIEPSLLNSIFYNAPIGRSRRGQWCKDLATGMAKTAEGWIFDPSLISELGSNPQVSDTALILTPASTQVEIQVTDLSSMGGAILDQVPLLICLCLEKELCISLLPWTTIEDQTITLTNISTSLIGSECYIYPLWRVNMGTEQTPIYAYGSYVKNII